MSTRPSPSRRGRSAALGALGATLALGLSACGLGGAGGSLPGGADVGSDPVRISAEFADVLDLVPQSNVKVQNVTVGRVTKVRLSADGRSARVDMLVRRDAGLRTGTKARLQQTSLLGEKYVALEPPASGDGGASSALLRSGATLGPADTDAAATAEQVLGSLSLVLNGGGVGQFQEISRELQKVGADGRTAQARAFLEQLDRFVGVLDSRKAAITSALDGLARLGTNLEADTDKIEDVLDGISPGLAVLRDQRPQLTAMLQALDRLSTITVDTLDRSQADIVADLRALDPILTQLAKAGDALPRSLEVLLTYPFPDSVLGAIRGDYLNAFIVTAFTTPGPCGTGPNGCVWGGSGTTAGTTSGRAGTVARGATSAPPTFLPSTDSALPGVGTPSVVGPSILPGTPTSSPSAGGSDTAGPTGFPSSSGSPSGSDTPSGSSSSSPSSSDTPSSGGQ